MGLVSKLDPKVDGEVSASIRNLASMHIISYLGNLRV